MKNILVPTDFSECSRKAERIGLQIAKKAGAEIHFLHLIKTPVDWVKLSLADEEKYPKVKTQIASAKNELHILENRAEALGLKCEVFLVFNKGREEIENHVVEHRHDFIVMGSHGQGGFKRVMGSNAQKIVRHSLSPVLVVKEDTPDFKVNNIVFASSFEEDVHKPFRKIIEFADLMGADIHLLNINIPDHFVNTEIAEARMKAFLEHCPRGNCSINIYNSWREDAGIKFFAEKIKADVISIVTHGKSGILKLLETSISENLVNNANLPVLVVHINAE